MEESLLPDSELSWTSSLDGLLGYGRMVVRRNLSVGKHLLTFRGRDASGLAAERTVSITITPRVYNNANISGDGTVDAEDLVMLLADWGHTGLGDLDLDGVVGPLDLGMLLQQWGQ
jgi:hypothetical protein